MSERVIAPRNRGFLYLDSHPGGCLQLVADMWQAVPDPAPAPADRERPVALVLGSSAGYGLAATIAGLKRAGIRGIGVCFEKEPTERRSATAGWYRTAATAGLARQVGADMAWLNGDAFSDTTKDQVAELLAQRYSSRLDYLIYSVAAPRRTDPDTGASYASVLKPIGAPHRTKTLVFEDGAPVIREVESAPAEGDDIEQTVAVMGGADWERWIDHLADRGLLADGFTTAALSYIGSPLTAAIYRQGTIGAAKGHLEATARTLNERLDKLVGGRAVTSVNGAAVTQSSTAIPGIALYIGLLRGVLGESLVPPVGQLTDLWDQLTGATPLVLDDDGRVRLDTWELTDDVQAAVANRWHQATTATISDLADLDWFHAEVQRLYGFSVPGIDYHAAVETDIPWPTTT
ncbi:enoyl-[acyl-carrier-protein] reductase FabV [Streptomyces sp. SRF1]|uniref:enoyl-[acyl-carrier-protein] reductase FabV n=1 Tax=Streptomyces sp. SRF1 TaxID=1549642 RepID=UPI0025B154D0|nr:enoyl-[acyl-carrier-protein] reductase FabV [Streptomyces sp. SRF1]MDN3059385.1 enoyl-[acyl-carrier-protein] reductase FabV [Streptomyces sp. SRF1]